MSRTNKTAAALASLKSIFAPICEDVFNNAGSCAAFEALRAGIAALMLSDLSAAQDRAEISDFDRVVPERHSESLSYEDLDGWICADDRTAAFVSAWYARYMDTRADLCKRADGKIFVVTSRARIRDVG